VSAVLSRQSSPSLAVRISLLRDVILTSRVYREECYEVFQRPKFDRYSTLSSRLSFLDRFFLSATSLTILETVSDCWDPKDNMILELALSGAADLIVTGDDHLLRLAPWRGVRIVTPAVFLEAAGPS
jgi:putative PIN family toxin of toxin-antitoxin system